VNTLARKRPVLTFLLINFGWTWLFWLGAIPLRDRQDLLMTAIVIIGGFGPALAGALTLALRSSKGIDLSGKRIGAWIVASAVVFALLALRYVVGNVSGYDTLAADLTLGAPTVAAALFGSVVGGWVISSAVSRVREVRARMGSILPWRMPVNWAWLGFVFYPALILIAWGLAALLGLGIEYPALWGRPLGEVLPLYALTFALTAVAQGGNEEPGWRGLMQPELQKRHSPLIAALIVSAFWSLWHLPLYLNGFYGGPLVGGMLAGGIYRVLLSIFMAWLYNRSQGNLFLMVIAHASFNVMVNFLPTSDLGLLVLWLVVVAVVVFKSKMYRKRPARSQRSI
jgi:membrane protease YdiL (CAAX protease family)